MALQEREDIPLPFPVAEQQAVSHPGTGSLLDTLLWMREQSNDQVVRCDKAPVCLQGLTLGISKLSFQSHGPSPDIKCMRTGKELFQPEGRSYLNIGQKSGAIQNLSIQRPNPVTARRCAAALIRR